ncbi:hypothetical protein L2221_24880, partial [Xanthomonas perforans]|nr:hypothetical protein [Xanthomonas perforans]
KELTSLGLIGCRRFHRLYPSLIYVAGIIAAKFSAAVSFLGRWCNGGVLSAALTLPGLTIGIAAQV